jgi:hypothetical protein
MKEIGCFPAFSDLSGFQAFGSEVIHKKGRAEWPVSDHLWGLFV